MSKATATRANDIYETARENPYVQRLIEDDELRDSLRDAFDAARGAYGRATGNGKGAVKAVTSDKKVQKDLREAAESLKEASERLRKPPKRKGGLGKLLLVAVIGAVIALAVSEGARKAVLDTLFGAEEEFEYTSTTKHQRLLVGGGGKRARAERRQGAAHRRRDARQRRPPRRRRLDLRARRR